MAYNLDQIDKLEQCQGHELSACCGEWLFDGVCWICEQPAEPQCIKCTVNNELKKYCHGNKS